MRVRLHANMVSRTTWRCHRFDSNGTSLPTARGRGVAPRSQPRSRRWHGVLARSSPPSLGIRGWTGAGGRSRGCPWPASPSKLASVIVQVRCRGEDSSVHIFVTDVPDVNGEVPVRCCLQLLVGSYEGYAVAFGARQIKAVVDGMVNLQCNGAGPDEELLASAEQEDVWKPSNLREVAVGCVDFLPAGLLPHHISRLAEYEVWGTPLDVAGQKPSRLVRPLLGDEPLDGNAGVDGDSQRPRSSRRRATLSVWGRLTVKEQS